MNDPQVFKYSGAEPSNDVSPYHYTQCGLDDVYLLNGFHCHEVEDDSGVAIQNADGLHRAIALNIVRNKSVLSGKEVRFLRKLLDFTQADLALWLGYNPQQVARWEKGHGEINSCADRLLRVIYTASLEERGGDILSTIRELAELDAQVSDRQCFRETSEGWQAAA